MNRLELDSRAGIHLRLFALPSNAVLVLGDEALRTSAQELVRAVCNNVTIDWTLCENVRAKMRVLVKRILRRYGYPPDKQERRRRCRANFTAGEGNA